MFPRIMLMVFLLVLVFNVQSANFEKDEHYQVIAGELSQNKEVTEYFSFYCSHCFRQETLIQNMLASLPVGTKFSKNHVDSMPGRNIGIEHVLTKALIVSELLQVEEKIVPAIFNYIHVNKASFDSPADVKNIFLMNGIDAQSYDKTFASFTVNTQFKKMQQQTAAIRKQGIGTVPTVIVNGKYRVLTNSLKGEGEFLELVSFLLDKDI
ncbi:thiol:disulfide interchange protein DsbA/DsbL [Paraglaciecola sp.]|uniref:thiol:disulfide interchange protein DsbA/DsbL n=1 Tax=Paraglaciecola sp. TaxID=1920173 RepID=UPI0030F4575C